MASGRAYDKNGNVTKEEDKDILSIQYNIINLPSHITFKTAIPSITFTLGKVKS